MGLLEMEKDLEASIISATAERMQYWSERYASRIAKYQARITKINARKQKCKSTWCENRYDSRITKLEKYVEFNTKLQQFCLAQKEEKEKENELKGQIGQVKTFNGVADIRK